MPPVRQIQFCCRGHLVLPMKPLPCCNLVWRTTLFHATIARDNSPCWLSKTVSGTVAVPRNFISSPIPSPPSIFTSGDGGQPLAPTA